MRAILFFGVLIAACWAFDVATFQGRYSEAAWQGAKYQGQQFNRAIGSFLKQVGLTR